MRQVLSLIIVAASSIAFLHCAANASGSGLSGDQAPTQTNNDTNSKDAGPAKDSGSTARDAGAPKPDAAADAGKDAAVSHPPDAAPPPPPPMGIACKNLNDCCTSLPSTQAAACFIALDQRNELACAAAYATFDCSIAGYQMGPSCSDLRACCTALSTITDDPAAKADYDSTYCTGGFFGQADWETLDENICSADMTYINGDGYCQ